MEHKRKAKHLSKIVLVICLMVLTFLVEKNAMADTFSNDDEIQPEKGVAYYLEVSYDGVDKNGVESSDSSLADVRSGYIYVEDKIPDGLEFIRICNN